MSSLRLQPFRDDCDKLVFDDVELQYVGRLLGKPELVKLVEQINYTCTHTAKAGLKTENCSYVSVLELSLGLTV